jgi:hypothetical protein
VSKSWRDYVAGFSKIDRGLEGLEWLTTRFLYVLWVPTLAFLLRIFLSRYFRQSLIVEVYVAGSAAVTFAAWLWMPTCLWAILCSWFLFGTVVVLLHVVLLSKVFGDVQSAERSLILFICNVVQSVLTFSIWYQLKADLPKGDALFNAILVFATLGYPNEAPALLVGTQIATNFLLLAIFLAHLVGRVGYRRKESEGITRRALLREIRKLKQ